MIQQREGIDKNGHRYIARTIKQKQTVDTRAILYTIPHHTKDTTYSIKLGRYKRQTFDEGCIDEGSVITCPYCNSYIERPRDETKPKSELTLDNEEFSELIDFLLELIKKGLVSKPILQIKDPDEFKLIQSMLSDAESGSLLITKLLEALKIASESEKDNIVEALTEDSLTILTSLNDMVTQQHKRDILSRFEDLLTLHESEPSWHKFFKDNSWLLGFGTLEEKSKLLKNEARVGSALPDSTGTRTDFLYATYGTYSSPIVIEIKKPDTPIFDEEKYRDDIYRLSKEMSGALNQLMMQCHKFTERMGERDYSKKLEEEDVYPSSPRGVLVIGNTKEFVSDDGQTNIAKCKLFNQFKCSLNYISIITYDELLESVKRSMEIDKDN